MEFQKTSLFSILLLNVCESNVNRSHMISFLSTKISLTRINQAFLGRLQDELCGLTSFLENTSCQKMALIV